MLREKMIGHHAHKPHEFRWRSREISRLEGLSDAVFGFAVTLLIVSLEVPKTSGELLETMRGFASFGSPLRSSICSGTGSSPSSGATGWRTVRPWR